MYSTKSVLWYDITLSLLGAGLTIHLVPPNGLPVFYTAGSLLCRQEGEFSHI
jgi:hypothetical protein